MVCFLEMLLVLKNHNEILALFGIDINGLQSSMTNYQLFVIGSNGEITEDTSLR